MKMRTRQEMFDIVAVHLIRQREKSKNQFGCAYRGHDGCKCGVGALIADEDYDSSLEGVSVGQDSSTTDSQLRVVRAARCPREDRNFLGDLQIVHDTYDVEQWPEKLIAFAEVRSLDLTALADALERL